MRDIAFNLNGKDIELSIEVDDLLVDVLRDRLGLTGTKIGCRKGDCGACSVLIDGKSVSACLVAAYKVHGRSVVTIEGVGTAESLHPLQKSFIEHGAVQCGYCSPGMIISAKALLDDNPTPSREEIKEAISGNLCRCTGYKKILEAIHEASLVVRREMVPVESTWHKGVASRIGTRHANILAQEKVTGRARFGADTYMEGMAYIKILRSPYPHALIIKIETSQVEKTPGVLGLITSKDIAGENWVELYRSLKDQPVLAHEKIRYEGEAIVAVAAVSPKIAEEAIGKIQVQYELLEPVWSASDALLQGCPQIHREGNLLYSRQLVKGDVVRGFNEADVVVEERFSTPIVEHCYLEPEAGVAFIDERDRLVVKTCCQDAHMIQRELSRILALDLDKIHIIQTYTGGGFGGKIDLSVQAILGAMALKIRRPVKLVLDREESFLSTPKRHAYEMKVRLGAKKDGTFTALHFDVLSNGGAYSSWSQGVLLKSAIHASGPYYIPNVLFEGKVVYTNYPFCGAFRGFGIPQVCFALESLVDILANNLGLDSLKIRLKNALDRGLSTATGQVLNHSVGIKKTLEAIQETYRSELEQVKNSRRGGPVQEGLGIGCMMYGFGFTGVSNPSEAEVELLEDGRICIYVGACDIGQGSSTVMAQIAAEELRVPVEIIDVVSADTDRTPDSGMTAASRQTYISGNAVRVAARRLRDALIEAASRVLEIPREQIGIEEGTFYSDAHPSRKVSLKDLYHFCLKEGSLRQQGFFDPEVTGLDENCQGSPFSAYAFGTHLAKVAVDTETGEIKVKNLWAAHDAGKAINITAVEGQIEGGAVMGVGYALMEEFMPMKTYNFKQYAIPTVHDVPEIATIIVEDKEPTGPFGAKGLGEPTLTPTAPAIANAVYDAVGIRIKDLPILPEKVIFTADSKNIMGKGRI